jgi:Domain of unknown function (DUF4383)
MAHIPVNHPLRRLYKTLTAFAGLYILVFGIIGLVRTHGTPLFARHDLPWVLGLRTNLAFSILSIAGGIVMLAAVAIGRNIDHYMEILAGGVFIFVGLLMLALLQTDANFLGFSLVNCVVSFILGMVVFAAGLYGKTGSDEDVAAEEAFRHHQR